MLGRLPGGSLERLLEFRRASGGPQVDFSAQAASRGKSRKQRRWPNELSKEERELGMEGAEKAGVGSREGPALPSRQRGLNSIMKSLWRSITARARGGGICALCQIFSGALAAADRQG